jgi:hypothetical protein
LIAFEARADIFVPGQLSDTTLASERASMTCRRTIWRIRRRFGARALGFVGVHRKRQSGLGQSRVPTTTLIGRFSSTGAPAAATRSSHRAVRRMYKNCLESPPNCSKVIWRPAEAPSLPCLDRGRLNRRQLGCARGFFSAIENGGYGEMRRRYLVKMVRVGRVGPGPSGPTGASTSPRQRRCSSGGKSRPARAAVARCCSSRSKRQACSVGKCVDAAEAAVFS